MLSRNLFLGFSSLFLIAAIPIAVYLASQQQTLRSQAFAPDIAPSFKITGPRVIDYRAIASDVILQISYPKNSLIPDSFRVANTIPSLDTANTYNFTAPAQTINWQLDSTVLSPTVYLQFRINNQWQTPLFTSIPFQNSSR